MDRPCDIYAITHKKSGKRYVGSSVDSHYRFIKHRCELNAGRHHCAYLQNAWSKYGPDAFSFSVLETIPTNNRTIRAIAELKWINEAPCYNSRICNSNLNNFENSPQTRKKIADGIVRMLLEHPEHRLVLIERGQAMADFMKSDPGRALAAANTKRRWKDPKERKKLSSGLKAYWSRPEASKEQSDRLRKIKGTPEARTKNSEQAKAAWSDPNGALRNRKKTRWADPKAKERQAEKMRASWARRKSGA